METRIHVSVLRERDDRVREMWIKAMEAKFVRDELNKCQRVEGVNAYENCKWLADKYVELMRTAKVKGYKRVDLE